MTSPVKCYQQEMHNNVGYFATWLPSDPIQLGDVGILEGGRFRRHGSLQELGIQHAGVREGSAENMSYSASAKRSTGVSAGVSTVVPVGEAEVCIQFSREGGYVFEAIGIRQVEIANRLELGKLILGVHGQGRWDTRWLVIDSIYTAESATILVSEEKSAEIVLKGSANVPLGSLPLADPKLGLTVTASSGKIVHLVAQNHLSPLYSCIKVHDPWIGQASVSSVRGVTGDKALEQIARPTISDLLDS